MGRQFKPKFTKIEVEEKTEVAITDAITTSKVIRTGIDQYRQDRSRPRYEQNYRRGDFRGNVRSFDRE